MGRRSKSLKRLIRETRCIACKKGTIKVKVLPSAEVPETVNTVDPGNMGLNMHEEQAIVMFMNTLTYGAEP